MKPGIAILTGLLGLASWLNWDRPGLDRPSLDRPGLDRPAFKIGMKNGGEFQVLEVLDHEGQLEKYTANIKAPVCEEGICYNVNVRFDWNVIGEFIDYQVPPHDPLTKLDHEPFTLGDYAKLRSILKNHDLIFTGMKAEELVVETAEADVDGYSGATVEAIKEEVVDGALFTCHTLWHVANGAVVDSIRRHTRVLLDQPLIDRIFALQSSTANYYLIDNLSEAQFERNITQLLDLVKNAQGYFPKNTLEKIPPKLFAKNEVQNFLTQHYDSLSYYTQVAALNKLQKVSLQEKLVEKLLTEISDRNSAQNQKIITLIIKNNNPASIRRLMDLLIEKKVKLSEANYQLLQKLNVARIEGLEKI